MTAAAAALLASSKLSKSHNSKSKHSDKKKSGKRTSKTQLSDSEDPPPSYYDDYSGGKGGGLEDSEADPYAFEITSSAFPIPSKEVEDSAEYSGEEYEKTSEKEDSREEYEREDSEEYEKEKQKSSATNAVPKSAPISMQDRIAQILQRTGSQQFQGDKSEEEEISDEDSDEKFKTQLPQARNEKKTASPKQEEEGLDGNDSDSGRSGLSDSLGVGSSDFEVNLPPRPSADRTRLSMSNLDNEKIPVKKDELTGEVATPSRYEQETSLVKPQQDEDSPGEKDEYEDDEFELDRTLVEENKEVVPLYSPVQNEEGESLSRQEEESYSSEHGDVKPLLQVDPISSPIEGYGTQALGAQDSPVYSSVSGDSQGKPLDGSATFGYGEDAFEETERSRLEEDITSKSEDQTVWHLFISLL